MTARLQLEYDGSGFSGWAFQPGARTIQGELETAIATILRRPVALAVAGRTDAGVHAWGRSPRMKVRLPRWQPQCRAPAGCGRRALR